MREEFKSSEWADFRQRYEGTFGWYELEDKRETLVKLISVTQNGLNFSDETGYIYTAIPDKGNVFKFIPVTCGVYNLPNDVVFCQRIPARQWRRGMCSANTTFHSLTGKTRYFGPSFTLLQQLFNPDPATQTVKDTFLQRLEGNAALNNMFSIIGTNVYCLNVCIGSYKRGKILLKDKLFAQEVSDLMRETNLPIEVEVLNG